jgi:multicomponent Na+:H+ antiporter subunit B
VTIRFRLALFSVAAAGLAVLLVWGFAGLPSFGDYQGRYGPIVAHGTVPQRHVTDAVTAVTFDYRGIDTLGEEFILFISVIGVLALLRTHREGGEDIEVDPIRDAPAPSESLALLGRILAPVVLVLGIYIVAHGHLTPGGGFAGGVVLAAGLLVLYVATGKVAMRRLRPVPTFEAVEAVGSLGFVLLGVGGLLAGAAFLHDFLPLGTSGLLTGGTIPVANVSVGIAVGGGVITVLSELLDQRLLSGESR